MTVSRLPVVASPATRSHYGNTRADMIDCEYGLMDQASPGWAEYNPYEGYEDMLGGNQT